jgi:hypothetical protein
MMRITDGPDKTSFRTSADSEFGTLALARKLARFVLPSTRLFYHK